ncbi:MAG: complex I subunit 1 family protein [Candidatus Hadarchaeales archaeon]
MIGQALNFLFSLLVFPGFLFVALLGLIYLGLDRKCCAHMQHRIGPPIWQEIYDFGKLMTKEDITPANADPIIFNAAPLLALGALLAVALIIPIASPNPLLSGAADVVVLIYLLNLPAIAMMLGGYSSGCAFGVVGAGRHVTQLMGYELVFIISILSVVMKTGLLGVSEIVKYQSLHGWTLFDLQLLPAFLAALFAVQGKLLRTPFDIPEAHQEIVAGPLTEYSGPKLALWRLAYDIETVLVFGLLASLFLGGPTEYLIGGLRIPAVADFIVKTLVLLFISVVIRTIMARLRIDQTLRLYWGAGVLLALVSLVLVGVK